ncbi:hypothetical protein [Legionella brunensis]|uniref:Ankyrin repeat-containing protein n=1 Tax=Legionella brunensis TaxID=29422 RepID=A0A0W0SE85_9GAMM|nr:hypothetical protein [Legionella brunensis]KTC81457.1 ankyrin repeat-containing protein [Legionella brunensis]
MTKKCYLIIPDLAVFYTDKNCSQKIATTIKNALSHRDLIICSTMEEAKEAGGIISNKQLSRAGIIELEIADDEILSDQQLLNFCDIILSLPTIEEKEDRLSSVIKTVYIKGFQLPFIELRTEKREALQVASLIANLKDDSQLLLSQPALLYLRQIHNKLLFLLLTDYQFFLNFENWRQYNAREAQGNGCVFDLFHGITALCERITALSKMSVTNLEDIKELQKLLSDSIFSGSTEKRGGVFREGYNSFPLVADAITVDGINELLLRIRSDNQADGFRIGRFTRSNIISQFCSAMSGIIREAQPWKKFKDEDGVTPEVLHELKALEQKAITEISKKQEKYASEDIAVIVNNFLQDFKPHEEVSSSNFWGSLLYYYGDLASTFRRNSPKLELQFDHQYSRDHALASAGNIAASSVNILDYTDDQLADLAKEIYEVITQGTEMIHLFSPEPKLAEKWANQAVNNYNCAITQAQSVEETIRIIDDLVHELEILHLFHDVNCRTNYLLMNFLFLSKSIKWSTEFNPNRLDAYSSQERVRQHKLGILRTDSIINNQIELVERNERIDQIYVFNKAGGQSLDYSDKELSEVEKDNQYVQISQQFVEKLDKFKKTFENSLDERIKKYDVQSTGQGTTSFFNSVPKECTGFAKALKQFREDYDSYTFFTSVATLGTVTEIAEDIKSLKDLTGFDDTWLSLRQNENKAQTTTSFTPIYQTK